MRPQGARTMLYHRYIKIFFAIVARLGLCSCYTYHDCKIQIERKKTESKDKKARTKYYGAKCSEWMIKIQNLL